MSTTDNIKRAKELLRLLDGVEQELDNIIAEIATTKQTSAVYWNRIQREISEQYERARIISTEWTQTNIPEVYKENIKAQLTRIKGKTFPSQGSPIDFTKFVSSDVSTQSLSALMGETTATFGTGFAAGEKTMLRLARLTQALNVNEKMINKAVSEGFEATGNISGSIVRLKDELLKASLDGKYITIINKNGKPERWKINTYAELVARTKLQETQTQAVINTAVASQKDLIQVSSHNTRTAYDSQFEGKIYSLTGNDPDFPAVVDLPPFHPNCLHTINIVSREGLSQQGILKKSIDFADGTSQTHPTRRGHIPVGERELK